MARDSSIDAAPGAIVLGASFAAGAVWATRVTPAWKNGVRRGSVDELVRLLASGADIDARDEYGQTALMLAARDGRAESVAWLVGHGAALDVTAKYGLSALMLAVVNGHVDVVRTLLRGGANLELQGTGAPGFAGKTALDLARARDDRGMVEMLGAADHRGRSE